MGSGLTELTCHSSLFVRLHYIVRCKCYFQLFCLPTNEHLRVIILDREHCVRVCCQGSHEDVVWMQVQCKEVCWCLHDEYQLQFKQKSCFFMAFSPMNWSCAKKKSSTATTGKTAMVLRLGFNLRKIKSNYHCAFKKNKTIAKYPDLSFQKPFSLVLLIALISL